jgi:hypothetical protein
MKRLQRPLGVFIAGCLLSGCIMQPPAAPPSKVAAKELQQQADSLISLVCGWDAPMVKAEVALARPDQITVHAIEDGADGPLKEIKRDGVTVSYYDLPRGFLTATATIKQVSTVASLRHIDEQDRETTKNFYGTTAVSELSLEQQEQHKKLDHPFADIDDLSSNNDQLLLFYKKNKIKKIIAYCYTG